MSYAILRMLNSILVTPYHYRCVKLNFAHTCSLTLDVFRLPCHSTRVNLNFENSYSLRLDVLPLACQYRCVKLYFTHT